MNITIKNKQYPARMTMGAMVRFKQMSGRDVSQMDGGVSDVAMLLFCMLKSACSADDVECDVKFDDFADNISLEDFARLQTEMGLDAKKKSKATTTTPSL